MIVNLMVTRNCNLKCKHCLGGKPTNQDISDNVRNKIFKSGTIIQLLQLNGGTVSIPSNGTLFTPRIEIELDIHCQM